MDRQPLTFRSAKLSDTGQLAELHYHSFPSPDFGIAARERKFREHPLINLDNFIVGETDGRMVAALNSIAFRVWFGGVSIPMQGIAGVVVAPEGRRYGYASDLVVEAMRRARANGTAISALYPFRHSFYSSLGYALAVQFKQWEIRPDDLPVYPERVRVRRGTAEDYEGMRACYRRVARRSMMMIDRNALDWRYRALADGKRYIAVYRDQTDTIRGYYTYSYQEQGAEGDRHMRLVIPELIYEDQAALRGLLGYVAALRDQFMDADIVSRADERLDLRLANPRSLGAIKGTLGEMFGPRTLFGAMIRVLDVKRAVEARRDFNAVNGSLRIVIDDPHLPANAGAYNLSFVNGLATVDAGAADSGTPEVRAGIGPFTQALTGYVSVAKARELGLIQGDDEAVALLDRAFRAPAPAMYDQF